MYKTLSAPLSVQIELTGTCPNKCSHCYNFWRDSDRADSRGALKLEQIESIFIKLASAKIFDVVITGGEPLLNKKGLLACLRLANRYGLGTSLNSSLAPLTMDYLEELRRFGLKSVLTSILGPNAAIHDAITGNNGSFEKTTRNALMVQETGIKLTANMVVSKRNLSFIKASKIAGNKTICRHQSWVSRKLRGFFQTPSFFRGIQTIFRGPSSGRERAGYQNRCSGKLSVMRDQGYR